MYFWKTTFKLSQTEKDLLKAQHINKLYLRLFDVDYSNDLQTPAPVAQIAFADSLPGGVTIVPVVYITNKTLQQTDSSGIYTLARNLLAKVNNISGNARFSFRELQIDCDWTDQSRDRYFYLLDLIRKKLKTEGKLLTTTIRLHQVKYYKRTGVPPVDRGMLMFYNMGKLSVTATRNSIYNDKDAGLYTKSLAAYPLPLDCALPIFGWGVHIRENMMKQLLSETMLGEITKNDNFQLSGEQHYIARSSFYLHGVYFKQGDMIKIEQTGPDLCVQAAKLAAKNIKPGARSIALFDLDSLTISYYHEKDFENVFNSFN